ncbi:MAG: restriction endonuclease, partial [Candidatus Dadabacteria bacterium]
MARRTNPHAHDWLSFVEVSGLLVSEPVLHAHFPQGPEGVSRPTVQALRGAWERFQVDPADSRRRVRWIDTVVFGLLEIPKAKWHRGASLPLKAVVTLDWADQPLRPAAVLEGPEGELALGFWSVAPGQGFDRVEKVPGRWRQPPQVKLEAWLRKTGTPFGLLTNGRAFRLLHVPPGLPAAWIEFDADLWFEEKAVLDAFYTLLRAQRWFGTPEQRLSALVRESAERQADLTDSLGVQVRQAVERLILAIDRQDQAAGGRILANVPADDLYRAAVYAVMRLVFLLFAEERGLLPHGVVFFDDGYGLGRLLKTLEDERRERPDTFRREADAWPRLLALFRLVFHGSTHPDLTLPAYGGDLFDPRAFQAMAVLEHPDLRIPNADVYAILRALTHGTAKIGRDAIAQRYSYRTLDVEHIGYLYEGLLDHRAARAGADPMVKFAGAGEAAYPLSDLEGLSPDEVVEYAATRGALKGDPTRIRERLEHPDPADQEALNRYAPAVARRCRPYASIIQVDEVVEPGRFYLTTSASRRATGTHYTPVQYTRAMVAETLEPLVYVGAHGRPEEPKRLRPPRQLLDLKVCDPAMGSGAFLVQVVRYLAERLVDAWWAEREKHPPGTPLYLPFAEPVPDREERVPLPDEREEALVWARRFVAERCVYGVDANPLAVEMAKLSLWLVTLARDKPFSFLDHALRCGDSLVGVCRAEDLADWRIRSTPPAERPVNRPILADRVRSRMEEARRLRLELEAFSVRAPADVRAKERLHRQAQDRVDELRTWADL